mgnify:FL=1
MTEGETKADQLLLYFLKGLAAEVTHLHHFFLIALHQLINRVDACALEAIIGTD